MMLALLAVVVNVGALPPAHFHPPGNVVLCPPLPSCNSRIAAVADTPPVGQFVTLGVMFPVSVIVKLFESDRSNTGVALNATIVMDSLKAPNDVMPRLFSRPSMRTVPLGT